MKFNWTTQLPRLTSDLHNHFTLFTASPDRNDCQNELIGV